MKRKCNWQNCYEEATWQRDGRVGGVDHYCQIHFSLLSNTTLPSNPLDVPATGGSPEEKLLRLRELNEAYTAASVALNLSATKTSNSTIPNQLSESTEALNRSESTRLGYTVTRPDLQFSAPNVMPPKQPEKMSCAVRCSAHGEQYEYTVGRGDCEECVKETIEEREAIIAEGIKHDDGKSPIGLIPWEALEEEGMAFLEGQDKYGTYNFTNGLSVLRCLCASIRHVSKAIWVGTFDPDSNRSVTHLGAARAEIGMAIFMIRRRPEFDDRFKGGK